MKVAYTAGPYRAPTAHGIVENIRAAEAVALELWRMGFAVICPHKNTALFDGAAPDGVWMEGDLAMLRRCDLVVVLPDWETSEGTRAEIREAHNELIPVYYWPEDREQIQLALRDPDPFIDYGEGEPAVAFEADPRLVRILSGTDGPDD